MLLIGMQWIFHCFQVQIDSVGVFVWALAPFFCGFGVFPVLLRFFFRWRNASLAGGFAGRRFLCGCCFLVFASIDFSDFKDFASLYRVFAAYSHVRTEPLARQWPHSKNKKSEFCFGGACIFCFGEFNAGNSLRKQFGIRDSGHRKNARVRLHQLARPIEVVSS